MQGGIGQRQVEFVRIPDLAFVGRSFPDTTAAVVSKDYFAGTPFPVSMTLGAPVLLAYPLILDFKRLWVGFATESLRSDSVTAKTEFVEGLPILDLKADNTHLRTIFDTGAAYSVLNAAHTAALGLDLEPGYTLEVNDPAGGTGQLPVKRLCAISTSRRYPSVHASSWSSI